MIPVRLGGDCFNVIYSSYLKEFLSLSFCLGIIGGKPRHSLYFVGFQDDKLIYMDPHYCQKALIDVTEPNFPLDTFHCLTPRKAPLQSIDPSCTIGFFIKSKQELTHFTEWVEQIQERTHQAGDYPIFVLNHGNNIQDLAHEMPEKVLRMKYRLVDSRGNVQKVINTEDFVLL